MKGLIKKLCVWILTREARIVLRRFSPRIIAITGSVGKTTTKDAVFFALNGSVSVRRSKKSENSEIGVPLTILGLTNAWNNPLKWLWNIGNGAYTALFSRTYPDWLVLEIGADHPGDIRAFTEWITPDIVILTWLSKVPVHVEYFETPEAVWKEKEILAHALKENGAFVFNADNEPIQMIAGRVAKKHVSYGFVEDASVTVKAYKPIYKRGARLRTVVGMRADIIAHGTKYTFSTEGILGKQYVYTVLCALAIADLLHVPMDAVLQRLQEYIGTKGRMRLLSGIRKSVVIDDSYNASPVAMKEALDVLKLTETSGKRIAILGDMLELGTYSVDAHEEVGVYAIQSVDILITVGIRARDIHRRAEELGFDSARAVHFHDAWEASREIQKYVGNGDLILVKGSQGMRMERIIEKLLLDPITAPEVLVRQEYAWKVRNK